MNKKKLIRNILIYILLFIIEILINSFDTLNVPIMGYATSFYLFTLSVVLIFYFYFRILDRTTRRYLLTIAILLAALVLFRASKYIAFEETHFIARHLWYLYYLPFLYIPNFVMLASLSVGEDGLVKHTIFKLVTFLISTILVLFVLTNDLHQFVFKFNPEFQSWDSDYSYGVLYFILIGAIALEIIITLIILYKKCSLSLAKRRMWLPILPVFYTIIWMVLYATGAFGSISSYFGELPDVFGFSIAGFFLGCIAIGLIPTNKYSKDLFSKSNVLAFLMDKKGNTIDLPKDLEGVDLSFEKEEMIDNSKRLHKNKITNGYIYWMDDIGSINSINQKLKDTLDSMMNENEIISFENSLKEKRSQMEAKNKAYNDITRALKNELSFIKDLAIEADRNIDLYEKNIKFITILAIYIKRCSNLILLGSERDCISYEDLFISLNEVLLYIEKANIKSCIYKSFKDKNIDKEEAIEIFKGFGHLLSLSIKSLNGILIYLNDNEIKIVLEGAIIGDSNFNIEVEDNTSYIKFNVGGNGNAL